MRSAFVKIVWLAGVHDELQPGGRDFETRAHSLPPPAMCFYPSAMVPE
jgi:hypothetical protein